MAGLIVALLCLCIYLVFGSWVCGGIFFVGCILAVIGFSLKTN